MRCRGRGVTGAGRRRQPWGSRWLRVRGNTNLAQVELGVGQDLQIVEVTDNVSLDTLTLGAPTNPLLRLELHGNPALAPEAQQLLLDLVGEQTSLTLE